MRLPPRDQFAEHWHQVVTARAHVADDVLRHWYHHRGELVVYLQLLSVPVPVVYGRSADENPFDRMVGARA